METCSVDGCHKSAYSRSWCRAHYVRWLRHGNPLAGKTGKGAAAEWLNGALTMQTDDCIEWHFAVDGDGYGVTRHEGQAITVSRAVCLRKYGKPPAANTEAAHSCGNRSCCNHQHLRWATAAENENDKIGHGTVLLGERANTAKLTASDVLSIRRRGADVPARELAKEFAVSRSAVSRIIQRTQWGWLPDATDQPQRSN